MEFVSWNDEIPNIWEKMFQTTSQIFVFVFTSGHQTQASQATKGARLFGSLLQNFGGGFPPKKTRNLGDT